jgi:hypothetical protein
MHSFNVNSRNSYETIGSQQYYPRKKPTTCIQAATVVLLALILLTLAVILVALVYGGLAVAHAYADAKVSMGEMGGYVADIAQVFGLLKECIVKSGMCKAAVSAFDV